MSRARLRDNIGRVNDATERLDKRSRRRLERRVDLDCIHRGHSDEFSESTRQTGDAVSANLRLQGERYRLAVLVGVVVGMTREDVDVSAAEPDSRNAYQHFI